MKCDNKTDSMPSMGGFIDVSMQNLGGERNMCHVADDDAVCAQVSP